MKKVLLRFGGPCLFVLSLCSPLPLFAQVDSQAPYIMVRVENASLKSSYFEVRDVVCRTQISTECRVAALLAGSTKCRDHRGSDQCRQAREISAGSECLPGMLFHDRLGSGQQIELSVCADNTGKGRVATRNSETAPWIQHHWVEAGETIEVK